MQIYRLRGSRTRTIMPVMDSSFASLHPVDRTTPSAATVIELTDGRRVTLEPVQPVDSAGERAFVNALSQASRYRRFHFGLRELSPEQARAMTEIDQHHHVAFVARPLGATAIVADARYVMRADSADAEFAIAIADAWQGAGLGRLLLTRLTAHAREHGVDRLFGDVLWGNAPMIQLARQLGATLRRVPGDATVVRVEFDLGATSREGGVALSSASALNS
jgi:acetyltransferase